LKIYKIESGFILIALDYHIPVGVLSFLLEACKLPSVVDRDEDLPDDEESNANEDDTQDDSEDDPPDVHRYGTDLSIK